MKDQNPTDRLLPYPDHPLLKYALKSPILLWRLGFGPIIGKLFLVLTTTGRKSGLPRRTVVEYHHYNGQIFIMAAWPESDWYRNIQNNPRVTVQTAAGVERCTARRITADEELKQVFGFVEKNPLFKSFWEKLGGPETVEDFLAEKDRYHLITFEKTDASTPPPLTTDLVWIWPALLIMGMIGFWIGRQTARKT